MSYSSSAHEPLLHAGKVMRPYPPPIGKRTITPSNVQTTGMFRTHRKAKDPGVSSESKRAEIPANPSIISDLDPNHQETNSITPDSTMVKEYEVRRSLEKSRVELTTPEQVEKFLNESTISIEAQSGDRIETPAKAMPMTAEDEREQVDFDAELQEAAAAAANNAQRMLLTKRLRVAEKEREKTSKFGTGSDLRYVDPAVALGLRQPVLKLRKFTIPPSMRSLDEHVRAIELAEVREADLMTILEDHRAEIRMSKALLAERRSLQQSNDEQHAAASRRVLFLEGKLADLAEPRKSSETASPATSKRKMDDVQ